MLPPASIKAPFRSDPELLWADDICSLLYTCYCQAISNYQETASSICRLRLAVVSVTIQASARTQGLRDFEGDKDMSTARSDAACRSTIHKHVFFTVCLSFISPPHLLFPFQTSRTLFLNSLSPRFSLPKKVGESEVGRIRHLFGHIIDSSIYRASNAFHASLSSIFALNPHKSAFRTGLRLRPPLSCRRLLCHQPRDTISPQIRSLKIRGQK